MAERRQPHEARPWWRESMVWLVIGLVVLLYGVLGGLRAAYWTDLVQGICIIVLSMTTP